jgi:biotin transporter BioY
MLSNQGTHKQIKFWAILAGSVPMAALGFLWFCHLIGWVDVYHKSLIVGGTIFFFISIIWWWWAIFKIAELAFLLHGTSERFDEVRKDIINIRNDIKDL